MSQHESQTHSNDRVEGAHPSTTLCLVLENLLDEPARGLSAWARTTTGIVAFLFVLQLLTGALLAFYYVPSADAAHATVAYVEKVAPAGSWLRALHFYGSQLLPLALALHLAQMLWRGAFARKPVGWTASVVLLALSMSNGATGYSLPFDARAFFSTRVAGSIAGGLPFAGPALRTWLVGGAEISTLTLTRFYALHALFVPALLLAVATARLFVFRDSTTTNSSLDYSWARAQFARNAVVVGVVFFALALYALKSPAPLGPAAESAPPGYLPRPGAQFLWLFQLLKFFPKTAASLVAFLLPTLLFAALALLPFTRKGKLTPALQLKRRRKGLAVYAFGALLVVSMTTLAYFEDSRDPRIKTQLARQAEKEAEFRREPFVPKRTGETSGTNVGLQTASPSSTNSGATGVSEPPEAYSLQCAKCHGPHGEGKSIYPKLIGVSAQPRRTVEDIVAILNDPRSYDLESRMPSFARKLTDEEKRAIAEWVVSLK
jgi:ubiquinol-cytochrome c reductase cytochrome b subunit